MSTSGVSWDGFAAHRDSQRNIPIETAQGAGMNFTAFFSSTNLGFATKAQKIHGK